MAVVLNLGQACSCTILEKTKNNAWKVVSYADAENDQKFDECINRRLNEVYLHNKVRFADALKRYFSAKKFINEKFYITVSGLDSQYRTEIYSEQDMAGADLGKMSEDEILALVRNKMPDGIRELHKDYQPCVLHCAQYSENILAAAFIPFEYLDAIQGAFELAGFDLFGVYPLAYGVYNALDFVDGRPRMVYLQDATMVFSNLGLVVWPKPTSNFLEQRELDRFLYEEFAKIYSIEASGMTYIALTAQQAVAALRIKTERFNPKFRIIGALGVLAREKELGESKDGEGLDGVIGSIRKLFSKETDESGKLQVE